MAIDRFEVFPAIHWVTAFGNRPSFSPDGLKIVFQRELSDGTSLWTVNRDGSGLERLYPPEGTPNAAASRPDWSWSDRIAFANHGEIWTIKPDKTQDARYYRGSAPAVTGMSYPSWYKDLNAIAAVRYYNDVHGAEQADIYKITPAAQERLTSSPHPIAGRPSVSPDGSKIAFAGNDGVFSQEQNQIWIVETASKTSHRLEPGNDAAYQGRSPNWAPQGNLIVFESTRPADPPTTTTPLSIFIIGTADHLARQITLSGVSHPEWSRQQDRIVFDSRLGIGYIDFHR